MLSCGFWPNGKQFDVEQSVLSFPYDNSVKRLTYFRVGPRLLGTHIFSWHSFSCPPSLSGFRVSAPIHHLIFDIVFAAYLHVDSSKLTEGRKLRTSNPRERMALTKPDKNPAKNSRIREFETPDSAHRGHEIWEKFPENHNGNVSSKSHNVRMGCCCKQLTTSTFLCSSCRFYICEGQRK